MKRSTETTRFLNYIAREQNKIRTELNAQINIEQGNVRAQADRATMAERDLQIALNKLNEITKKQTFIQEQLARIMRYSIS